MNHIIPPLRRPLAFLLGLTVLAAPLRAQEASELLAKYDFEEIPVYVPNWGAGLGSTYKPATGWKTPFAVSLDQDNPHSGDNSLRIELIEGDEKTKIVHSPAIEVEPSENERKVKIHLYVRAQGLSEEGAGIRVLERDEQKASIRLLNSKEILSPIANSTDWVELEAEGVLHSKTASISFMVVINQFEAPATIWIDDISVDLAK